jgi:hypothetical protein
MTGKNLAIGNICLFFFFFLWNLAIGNICLLFSFLFWLESGYWQSKSKIVQIVSKLLLPVYIYSK